MLEKAGILYTSAALDFDPAFYAGEEVGMPRGAVGDFLRAVKGESRSPKRGRVEVEED